jgi:hypothetical protein
MQWKKQNGRPGTGAAHLHVEFSQLPLEHRWVGGEGHWANICKKERGPDERGLDHSPKLQGSTEMKPRASPDPQQQSQPFVTKAPLTAPTTPTPSAKGILGTQETEKP